MEDIFSKYKKHKIVHNVSIIAASLFLALGVNMQLSGSDFSQNIKASIVDSQIENHIQKSDLYLEKKGDTISIKTISAVSNLEQMQFSMIYNNKSLKADNIINNIDNYTINYNYIDSGILNIQLSGDGKTSLTAGETIITMRASKNTETNEFINLLNANFTDTDGNTYLMSTSGLEL